MNPSEINIVIEVHNADIMASLLKLKSEVEERWGSRINMAFSGATEAHLLAKEIGEPICGFSHTIMLNTVLCQVGQVLG